MITRPFSVSDDALTGEIMEEVFQGIARDSITEPPKVAPPSSLVTVEAVALNSQG